MRELAEAYEKWWQSIMGEGVDERYAYIKAGTPYENPVRICSHDMLAGDPGRRTWHQHGPALATPAGGRWKIEIVQAGKYRISLRRFPRESGFGFNDEFPAAENTVQIENTMPASHNPGFTKAFLYLADFSKILDISPADKEVTFSMNLPAGKFDMEARLIDKDGRVYPSYFIYIEKIDTGNTP